MYVLGEWISVNLFPRLLLIQLDACKDGTADAIAGAWPGQAITQVVAMARRGQRMMGNGAIRDDTGVHPSRRDVSCR